jgi:hypothetical protein
MGAFYNACFGADPSLFEGPKLLLETALHEPELVLAKVETEAKTHWFLLATAVSLTAAGIALSAKVGAKAVRAGVWGQGDTRRDKWIRYASGAKQRPLEFSEERLNAILSGQ